MKQYKSDCARKASRWRMAGSGSSGRCRRHARVLRGALLSLGVSVLSVTAAHAADRNWTGVISTDASNPGNWDTGLPGVGDNAIFDTTSPNGAAFSGAVMLPLNFLIVGNNSSGSLTVQNGAVIAPTNNFFIGVAGGSSGAVTVTGSGTQINAGNAFAIGYGGNGTLLVSEGGGITTTGETRLGVLAGSVGTGRIESSGSNLTVGGDLVVGDSGKGVLDIAGGGMVSVAGKTFLGNAAGSTGTATVTGSGSIWTATGDFANGFSGTGSLTIANGGKVQAGSGFFLAVNAGSTGTLNIGAAQGDAPQAPGTLDTAMVTFGNGTGTLNFNHTSSSYIFSPALALAGTLNQIAGTTILTGNGVNFGGPTNVIGGSLIVNSNFSGTTVNVTGGTLGGTGTIAAANILSGGTLAPGNSIGTMSLATSVNFNAGSVYEVEINSAGQSDLITGPGFGNIFGGTVRVIPLAGADPTTTYTILTAGAGVAGTFDDVIGTAFLTPTLSYNATNVFLNVSIASDFCLAGFTFNQCQSARGAQSLGAGNAIYNAVLALPTYQEAQGAIDALSGEIHSSILSGLMEDSRFSRDAAMDRIRSAFGDDNAASLPVMAYADGDSMDAARADTSGPAIWSQVFGAVGHLGGNGNAAQLNRGTGGILVGGDVSVADRLRLGLFGGYSYSGFNIGAPQASSAQANSFHAGAYGGGQWDALALRFGGAASWHSLAVNRSPAFAGFADSLSSAYGARTLQAFGEAAYRFNAGDAGIEPFVNAAYVNQQASGTSETGGAAALMVSGRSANAGFSTLGVRAETEVAVGEKPATVRGMAGWRHAFGATPVATMNYLSGGSAFTVAGVPTARDVLILEAGLDINLSQKSELGLSYSGQFGSGMIDQSLRANLLAKF